MLNLLCAALAPTHFSHQLWLTLFTAFAVLGGASHLMTRSYRDDTGTTLTHAETITGNAEIDFDQLVPIAANTAYVINFTRSQLKSLVILSDQNITIYTNAASTGSPTDTIAIVANQLYAWSLAQDTLTAGKGLVACPITANVTGGLFITNAAGSAANVKIRAILAT